MYHEENRYIVFILFLAALLLLTACGGQEAQAPAPEAAPAETAADVDVTRIMGTIYYRDK